VSYIPLKELCGRGYSLKGVYVRRFPFKVSDVSYIPFEKGKSETFKGACIEVKGNVRIIL
jgi:hypothetical protein